MSDIEIATRFLEAMSSRDFETAQRLFAADAEVVAPDGPPLSSSEAFANWEGSTISTSGLRTALLAKRKA